jgi:hypothetical protein
MVDNVENGFKRPVTRDKRKPFGSRQQKLAYEERPGYHRHWFNDTPGRVEQALEAGYTYVQDKDGKKVSRVVGVAEGGGPLTAFLMEIPEEWYKEDMAAEQRRVDEMDGAIRKGAVSGEPGKDGRYVPEHLGIKIQTQRGGR